MRRREAPTSASGTPIASIMSEKVVTVRPELSVDSLRELLLRQGLSRVPVVDANGHAVGMVSLTDLVVDSHERDDEPQAELDAAARRALPRGTHLASPVKTVADLMSRTVLSLPVSATVAQAAESLVAHHLHGMPVCSADKRVVGFISSSDLLAWLAGLR